MALFKKTKQQHATDLVAGMAKQVSGGSFLRRVIFGVIAGRNRKGHTLTGGAGAQKRTSHKAITDVLAPSQGMPARYKALK